MILIIIISLKVKKSNFFFLNNLCDCFLMKASQVDDSGHRIPPKTAFFPVLSCKFPRSSGRNFIVHGNRKIRQVPLTGFYPEVRGIRVGNQPEINVSLRNLAGKVRIAAGFQLKNTGFRGTLIKSFSIFCVTERQTRKVF